MNKWYVIHTQTGHEERVKKFIEKKKTEEEYKDMLSQVLIPTETVSEVKDGKRRISERKFFPGYILVEMELNDKSWYMIRGIPGVTGFITSGKEPVALQESEIKNILAQAEAKKEKPSPKVEFKLGEAVRIIEGPFTNFNGNIEELNPDKGKLKVMVSIFGRSTPVELEYWQVERM